MSNIFTLKAVQISRQSWAVILRHDETSFIHQINLRDAKAREDYINRIKIKFLHIPRDELSVQLNKLAVELSLPEIPIKPIPIANIPGKSLDLPAPEPWPEPVNSADIINEISQTMSQFVALPNGAADAIALWTAHTHCFQAFSHTPRLHITSPQKQCGKTTLLNILGCLVPKSLRVENVSLEALFCVIDKWCPVILIDQDDSIFFNNDDLCSVLIAGHEHGRRMIRDGGDENELRAFDVFTPAVISSISAIPGTLQDRSIPVRLFRAKPGELRQRFDSMQTEHEENLRRKLSRFAADNFQRIKDCAPTLPPGAYNRLADNWRPLFAIAEIAGGDWPDRARAAFTALADQRDQDAQDIGVMLLTDIRRIFTEQRIERILST
ncbi:MAG TPA: DUF3631 domain-containing protein, partial [Phycisphaerae bacterium]|nr:DUF3631 domain-containing protein [Phycisphaerae bacterium]